MISNLHFVSLAAQSAECLLSVFSQSGAEFILAAADFISSERLLSDWRSPPLRCQQQTNLGPDACWYVVTMSSRPSARSIGLLRPLTDVTVTAGETATFECELSYEGIEVDWFLGGHKMEASDRVSPLSQRRAVKTT